MWPHRGFAEKEEETDDVLIALAVVLVLRKMEEAI